jgi:hypothetical protein
VSIQGVNSRGMGVLFFAVDPAESATVDIVVFPSLVEARRWWAARVKRYRDANDDVSAAELYLFRNAVLGWGPPDDGSLRDLHLVENCLRG